MNTNSIKYGPVRIEWDALYDFPIAIDHTKVNGRKYLVTQCEVVFWVGGTPYVVPKGFYFDGASLPWVVLLIPGYRKIGWHLFATLIHDYSCDFPSVIPRPIGDGIFVSVLLAIAEKSEGSRQKRLRRQAWFMYRAVSLFTVLQAMRGVTVIDLENQNEPHSFDSDVPSIPSNS